MKKMIKIIFAIATLLLSQYCLASPIKSLPQFEKEIFECLQKFSGKNRCIGKKIKSHLPKGNEAVMPVADQVEDVFVKWLANEKVANVYPVARREIGQFMVQQKYIIEDSSASILFFQLTYRKALGQWYVLNFNLSSKPDTIKRELGY